MEGGAREAEFAQRGGERLDRLDLVDEHHHARRVAPARQRLQERAERLTPPPVVADEEALRHRRGQRRHRLHGRRRRRRLFVAARGVDVHAERRAEPAGGSLLEGVGECGGEENRLAVGAQLAADLRHLRREAERDHGVGLVEDDEETRPTATCLVNNMSSSRPVVATTSPTAASTALTCSSRGAPP